MNHHSDSLSAPASSIMETGGVQTRSGAVLQRVMDRIASVDLPLFAALLALFSFSMPGREGPDSTGGVDLIAITKLLSRVATLGWFCIYLYLQWIRISTQQLTRQWATLRQCVSLLMPWLLFVGWAGFSVVWSPLKIVSLGQWLGLAALIVLALVIAFREAGKTVTTNRLPDLHAHLFWILSAYTVSILAVHLLFPSISGLDRSISVSGNNGVVHPTAAGATASLGALWAMDTFFNRRDRLRWCAIPAGCLHLSVLILANSRFSWGMFFLCGAIYVVCFCTWVARANIILLVGVVCLAAIIVDPGFSAIDNAIGGASNYFSRGQSSNQLQEVSGRGEMWRAVYGEFEKSPMIGCGYFVTSEKGRIFVWGIHANHDAHHLILQAMVSTGLIGAGLLVISILRSAVSLVSVLRTSFPLIDGCGDPRRFLLIIPIWFLGWTQGCTSFLGPIRPESVVFAVVLGLLTGIHVRARRAATVSTPLANTVAGEEIAR